MLPLLSLVDFFLLTTPSTTSQISTKFSVELTVKLLFDKVNNILCLSAPGA